MCNPLLLLLRSVLKLQILLKKIKLQIYHQMFLILGESSIFFVILYSKLFN